MKMLMCRPDHFDIEYSINPWMSVERKVDRKKALDQWEKLYETYLQLGLTIELVEQEEGLPDLVFTANAGLIWGGNAVLSRFQHKERQGEEPIWKQAFERLGFNVIVPPDGMAFEGAGDGLFLGSHLMCGYGFRSDRAAARYAAAALSVEVTELHLVDPRFYHLDTCFCPLDDSTAIYAPEAFDQDSIALLEKKVPHAIPVPPAVAAGFACNATPVGKTVVTSTAAEPIREELKDAGFSLITLEMGEFMKSGGAARCLSLPLDLGPVPSTPLQKTATA